MEFDLSLHRYSARWKKKNPAWKDDYEYQQQAKAAWEEEKKEAKRNKIRSMERKLRTEEAHQIRVGIKLRQFWQTHPNWTRFDVAFFAGMGVCIAFVTVSWYNTIYNRKTEPKKEITKN